MVLCFATLFWCLVERPAMTLSGALRRMLMGGVGGGKGSGKRSGSGSKKKEKELEMNQVENQNESPDQEHVIEVKMEKNLNMNQNNNSFIGVTNPLNITKEQRNQEALVKDISQITVGSIDENADDNKASKDEKSQSEPKTKKDKDEDIQKKKSADGGA